MTDTTTNPAPAKAPREQVAVRDWMNAAGQPISTGEEASATGLRYVHVPSAKRAKPDYNPETDAPPAGTAFECDMTKLPKEAVYMLAIFGGLTLAGNVVNTATNGPKGDKALNPVSIIVDRFAEIADLKWSEGGGAGGGVRYNKDLLAQAIATAKGETDPAPYLAKMDNKVDQKTGAVVANDTKGAISYGAYAYRNPKVKGEYEKLSGKGGVDLASL
jgi:hypothetical protein